MDFLTNLLLKTVLQVWTTFLHNWPFLLVSVLIAVALKLYIDASKVSAFLIRYRKAGVIGATVAAVATPLCSCGTTAIILGMMTGMMPWAPIVAFMVASPLTSPEGLVYSAGLFGWPFAIAFYIASILLGLAGGVAAGFAENRGWLANQSRLAVQGQVALNAGIAPRLEPAVSQEPVFPALNLSAPAFATCGCDSTPLVLAASIPVANAKASCGCGETVAAVAPAACGCGNAAAATAPAACGCGQTAVAAASLRNIPIADTGSDCGCESDARTPAASTCGCGTAAANAAAPARPPVTLRLFLSEAFSAGQRLLVMFFGFAFIGYLLNGLIPQAWVSAIFGSGNVYSVPLAATLGLPLYINSEASLPLVRALIDGGMSQGAALAFLITGAGTSIGAFAGALTIARWRVIALVIGTLWVGAVVIGYLYNLLLATGLV